MTSHFRRRPQWSTWGNNLFLQLAITMSLSLQLTTGLKNDHSSQPVYILRHDWASAEGHYAKGCTEYCESSSFRVFTVLRICDFRLFSKFRIRELSISLMGSADNNKFRECLKSTNSGNSQEIKPREYYQMYSIAFDEEVGNWSWSAFLPL